MVTIYFASSSIFATSLVEDLLQVSDCRELRTLEDLREILAAGALNQKEMNEVLNNAAGCGYHAVVKELIELSEGQIRPNQNGVNGALYEAVRNDYRDMIKMLIDQKEGQIKPNQQGINSALCKATRNGNQSLIEFLLDRKDGQLQPNQQGMHSSVSIAALYGRRAQLEWFLDRPKEKLHPTQSDVNKACALAAGEGFSLIVYGLLNRAADQLKPDQNGIIKAYRKAVNFRQSSVVQVLLPFVPVHERNVPIERQSTTSYDSGAAFEIHRFSETLINHCSTSASGPIKLIDAVFQNMQSRIKSIMLFTDVTDILDKAIDKFLPISDIGEAKKAVLYRISSDEDYEEKLGIVVTFVQTFHPDKIEQWVAGFVNESITAYANRDNPTSCSKGIRERTATGLRGIDTELDKFFAQVEAPILMKNWLKAWNLLELKNEATQELATQLKSKGITKSSSSADAAHAFKELAKEQLAIHGMQDRLEILAEIDIYAEAMLEENYDKELKSFIVKI